MKRRIFLILSLGSIAALAARKRSTLAAEKPVNFVMLFIDNVGYGDLGCYGNKEVKTPNIDRLSGQGVRCTDFYIASPSCMPSRGALLTARHPVRNGLNAQISKIPSTEQIGLPHEETLWPEYLKTKGYATSCFGKWNIGFAPGSRPTERGFDEYFGNISGNCDYYTHIYDGRHDLYRGTEPAHVEGYTTDLFAGAACDFIRRHADRPFFCYVPFNAAHYPAAKNKAPGEAVVWQAPEEYFAMYGVSPDTLDEKERYRAVLTALDAGIGRVVDQVDALGLSANTIVVLLSDNGVFMLPGRGLEAGSNAPLREGGVTVYEGGVRVPCIVRWPGRITAGSTCREPLSSMDFMIMSLKAAGIPRPTDRFLDGRDPTAALTGKGKSPHEYFCFRWKDSNAIRMGRYKLLQPGEDQPWVLYDLETDLAETKDIAAEHPGIAAKLQRTFEAWCKDAENR